MARSTRAARSRLTSGRWCRCQSSPPRPIRCQGRPSRGVPSTAFTRRTSVLRHGLGLLFRWQNLTGTGSTHATLDACCYCCSCKLCVAPARGRHVRRHRKGRHPSKGQRHRPDRQARRVECCTPSWGTGLGGGVSQFLTARHGDGTAVRQIRGPPAPSSPFSTAEGLHLCEGCQSTLVPGRPRRPATCTPEP